MSPAAPSPRTVLVTRPAHQAGALMTALAARGYAPVAAPVLTVAPTDAAYADHPCDALVFTSANGVQAFATRDARRDLTVFAVGAATAAAARRVQFTRIVAGHAGAAALAALILQTLPRGARVLYPSARDVAFDMEAALRDGGIQVDRVVAYAMEPETGLPPAALAALDAGCIALFYSARTLEVFQDLARRAGTSPGKATAVVIGADGPENPPGGFARTVAVPLPADEQDVLDALDRLESVKRDL